MTRSNFLTAFAVAFFGFCPVQATAEAGEQVAERLRAAAETDDHVRSILRRIDQMIASDRRQDIVQQYIHELYRVAPNGIATQSEVDRRNSKDLAQIRASRLAQMLRWDLNADGRIDETERQAFTGKDAGELEIAFLEGDQDKNGDLDIKELIALAQDVLKERHVRRETSILMLFDYDQDGRVVSNEIFQTLDAIAENPLGLDRKKREPTNQALSSNKCDAPKPSAKHEIIVLSGYEGSALSSVSVAGQSGVTHVANIEIEAGKRPIYLMLGAYSHMIWNISGATDRIEKVVAQSRKSDEGPGAGIIGVGNSKVHFLEGHDCFKAVHSMEGAKGILVYRQLEKNLGRAPDVMVAQYTIDHISLPSGEGQQAGDDGRDIIVYNGRRFELTPQGPKLIDEAENQPPGEQIFGATRVFRSLLRFHPGGFRKMNAEDVVAKGTVEDYVVYPQEAGLLQLLLDKRMEMTRDGFFLISENIPNFPAGLHGAHGVKFMLKSGIEMPGGSPGHSSVYSGETGECLSRGICR